MLLLLSFGDIARAAERSITVSDWWPVIVVGAALLGIAIGHRRFGISPRLAAIVEWALLWVHLLGVGRAVDLSGGGQWRAALRSEPRRARRELGFDWRPWYDIAAGRPILRLPLAAAYRSLFWQMSFSMSWLWWLRWDHRQAELLTNVTVGLLLTTAAFCMFPTLGPCVGMAECQDAYLEDLLGLRNGSLPSIDVMLLKRLIAFPSYHAVLAVLFT